PAVAALREAVEAGTAADEALAAAEQAAVEAARATADTTARRGRASYVGDVAKGVIDPGAAAMALVIGAARAAVGEGDVDTAWLADRAARRLAHELTQLRRAAPAPPRAPPAPPRQLSALRTAARPTPGPPPRERRSVR